MGSLAWSVLMLLAVIGLIPASLWAVQRLQRLRPPGAAAPRMQLLEQLPLGPRERLATVRVHGRLLVVGVTAQAVHLVAELPPEDAPQ